MNGVEHVKAGDVHLAVAVTGTGAALLLVHGFPLDRTVWRHQMNEMPGWKRVAPDLRGAGESQVPSSGYSMRRYADDLAAVLDAVGAPHAVCCGLSMGGYILFELWRRHPGRVKALILCDTKSEADTPEGKRGRDTLAAMARDAGLEAVAEQLLPKLVGRTTRTQNPVLVETVRTMVQRSPVAGIEGALRAMRDRADSTPSLAEITVPTLVMVGTEDELTPPAVVRAMAQRIPGARYAEIPGAGHLAPLERPGPFNSAVAEFLAKVG
jgi:pimeloyl-ACP methyl ester carboxylesterase